MTTLSRLQPRGLWTPLSEPQEAEDTAHWQGAASEAGGWLRVLWCECVQLFADVFGRGA